MARAVSFTPDAAQRIAAAVRKVERTPQSMTGDRSPPHGSATQFWAYLLSTDLSGQFWSWLKLMPAQNLPNPEDPWAPLEQNRPLFDIEVPTIFSEWTAREVNGNRNIPGGTIALMNFLGYDSKGEPVYVFSINQAFGDSFLPIHDHRDNVTGGGFAFSVYHPGTALPQQPWRP